MKQEENKPKRERGEKTWITTTSEVKDFLASLSYKDRRDLVENTIKATPEFEEWQKKQ